MPGLSLVHRKGLNRSLALDSLIDLKHEPYYEIEKLIDTNDMISVFSGYEGYPRKVSEYDNTVIFVEGLIYNKSESEIESSLVAISKSYTENNDFKTLITEFIDTSDGEFNVLICSKSPEKFIIFNDRWGRLPSFFYYDDNMFIFSRELKFILHFIPSIEFDRVSIAEFLLFGFVLGERTLVKRISKVMPSCVLNIEPSGSRIEVEISKVFGLNFEEPQQPLSRDECIEECKCLFLQSINDRVSKMQERQYNITADLSGGFDTRAVLGGLCKTRARVDYYTEHLVTVDESEYAVKVAALYDKEVTKIIASHEMNVSDMSRVIYRTDCLVNGWSALSCYRDEVERFKQSKRMSVRFAGLGGGEFMKRIPKSKKHYKTMTDMLKVGHLVGFGSIERICKVVKLGEQTFGSHLTEYFDEYPESTLRGKVKHWHFEYENKSVSFGEDRGRLHIWTVEPLWSKDLFSFVMTHIPERYADGTEFYFRFLQAVDPKLLNAPFFSTKIVKNSRISFYRGYLLKGFYDILLRMGRSSRIIRQLLKQYQRRTSIYKGSNERERIKHDILENYAQLNIFSALSDEGSIHDFIENCARGHLYLLLTLVLYFREIENRYGDKAYVKPVNTNSSAVMRPNTT
ncbi:MAG TPA: hypothetical protein VMW45_00940 [Dehalococcoidia bacterium]|nr:hypothetical protein [Dehalococcoidia bacterium]